MKKNPEIYAIGMQCFKSIVAIFLAIFIVGYVFTEFHDTIFDWISLAALGATQGLGIALRFSFPAFPSVCALLIALMFWLVCVNWKLCLIGKLSKEFSAKSCRIYTFSLVALVLTYFTWMGMSNSGWTALKVVITIGFLISMLLKLSLADMYNEDSNKQPSQE